jgi:hypothetical protein
MNLVDIRYGLAMGNWHKPGSILSLDVGNIIPFSDLKSEIIDIMETKPYRDLRTRQSDPGTAAALDDVRHWSLFNRSGKTDDYSDDFNYETKDKKVHGGPIIKSIFSSVPSLVNIRIAYMGPGAALDVHEEQLAFPRAGKKVALRCRFHIPIITDENAVMMLDGQQFHYEEGKLYAFNNGCIHDACNNGNTGRTHLLFDILLTKDAAEFFFLDSVTPWLDKNIQLSSPIGNIPIPKCAPEPGMSWEEFSSRELVWF